ncbi:hypothetical protein [Nonomuraea sp. NPDC050786]|uniref:hypothetical protein n=1 Tax=Nonomuraea sp. NPDC050786 TaxID=3154840 RepID=UPI0034095A01
MEEIFAAFLDGYGLFAIAERLTRNGIPSPSAHDPGPVGERRGLLLLPLPRGVRPGESRHASPQCLSTRGPCRPATGPLARPAVRSPQPRPDLRRSDGRTGPGPAGGSSARSGAPPDRRV